MTTILSDALAEITRLNRAAGETVFNPAVTAGLIELEAREAKVDALIDALENAAKRLQAVPPLNSTGSIWPHQWREMERLKHALHCSTFRLDENNHA